MSPDRWLWPLVITASAMAVSVMALADLHSPLRVLLVAWFLVVCPGMALVRFLQVKSALAEWTLATALSISIEIVLASVALYLGVWSPGLILATLVALSVLASGAYVLTSSHPKAI